MHVARMLHTCTRNIPVLKICFLKLVIDTRTYVNGGDVHVYTRAVDNFGGAYHSHGGSIATVVPRGSGGMLPRKILRF